MSGHQDAQKQAHVPEPGLGRGADPAHAQLARRHERQPHRADAGLLCVSRAPVHRLRAAVVLAVRPDRKEQLHGAVAEPVAPADQPGARVAGAHKAGRTDPLRPEARKHFAVHAEVDVAQGHRLRVCVLRGPHGVHVHPVALLPVAGGHHGPAVHRLDRRLVAGLHLRRAVPRDPAVSGKLRVQPAAADHQPARTAACPHD